jgi:hypothetical protein
MPTHLTETGQNAGRRFCNTSRDDGEGNSHLPYSVDIWDNKEWRDSLCVDCLRVYVNEVWDDTDTDIPQWVQQLRSKP